MLENSAVFKFRKDVLRRFESDYDNGTYYLFNVKNEVLWAGNKSCKLLLDLIDGVKSAGMLKEEFKNILQINDINAVNDSVDVILQELIKKGMIEEV